MIESPSAMNSRIKDNQLAHPQRLHKSGTGEQHNESRSQPSGVDYQSGLGINFEPLLDSEDAAKLLRIHPKTLQKLARNGEIQAVRIGKLWRFRASHLNDWVNSRMSY
jgi:excisionase family DNA binding protein